MNPYGIKNGQVVNASQVERGLACGCRCPACGGKLQAHRGEIRRTPYFAHYRGEDCRAGYESALHYFLRQAIFEEKKAVIPALRARADKDQFRHIARGVPWPNEFIVPERRVITLDEVVLEKREGRIIPDVIAMVKGRRLFIEIRVTHAIDQKKLDYIISNNYNVIEFNFSKEPGFLDYEWIKAIVTGRSWGYKGYGSVKWVNHDRFKEATKKLNHQLIGHYLNNIRINKNNAQPIGDPRNNRDRQCTLQWRP
jgi:hypothetical protein